MHTGMARLRANRLPAFLATYAPYPRECMRRCASGIQPLVFGYSRGGEGGQGDQGTTTGGNAFSGIAEVLGNRSSGLV